MHCTIFHVKSRDFCQLTTDHSYSILLYWFLKGPEKKNDLPERRKISVKKRGLSMFAHKSSNMFFT